MSTREPRGRLAVSTPTAFEYLAVDEPDEEEEEETVEPPKAEEQPVVTQPAPVIKQST